MWLRRIAFMCTLFVTMDERLVVHAVECWVFPVTFRERVAASDVAILAEALPITGEKNASRPPYRISRIIKGTAKSLKLGEHIALDWPRIEGETLVFITGDISRDGSVDWSYPDSVSEQDINYILQTAHVGKVDDHAIRQYISAIESECLATRNDASRELANVPFDRLRTAKGADVPQTA